MTTNIETNELRRIDLDGAKRRIEHAGYGSITAYDVDGRTLYPAQDCVKVLGFSKSSGIIKRCRHREKWLERILRSKRLDFEMTYQVIAKNFIPVSDVEMLIDRSARPDKAELKDWLLSSALVAKGATVESEYVADAQILEGVVVTGRDENDYVDSRELRDRVIDRVEVLERVKALLLVPKLSMLTTQQVADFYEVEYDTIKKTYQRNKAEIDEDGVALVKRDVWEGHYVPAKDSSKRGVVLYDIGDGRSVSVTPMGVKMFSPRAILRIGMLLRDSRVAREVRTQLLNIAQGAGTQQRVEAINEEERLLGPIIKSLIDGQLQDCTTALMDYVAHKNRHIKELEAYVQAKDAENAALCERISRWDNRALLNALLRRLAYVKYHEDYPYVWSCWRRTMYYQEKITLVRQCGKSYVDQLHDYEWPIAIKVATVMCKNCGVDISDILSHISDETALAVNE